jgi:putative PIN family toxin of toxin-antitoxin system
MRVVFDTNILILAQLGEPATSIMQAAFTGIPNESLAFYYSEAILAEYRDALTQVCLDAPHTFYPNQIAHLLSQVEAHGRLVHPTITLTTNDENACTHEPDNRFLECAIAVAADYIVTVNTNHFPATYQIPGTNHRIRIVPPGYLKQLLFAD